MKGRRPIYPQIPLPLSAPNRLDFGTYLAARSNHEAVEQLQRLASGDARNNVYLWGEPGTGKSHLLEAVCNLASARPLRCALVPLAQRVKLSPEMLDGLEQLDLVCVDDLDRIGSDARWEQALFGLFNRMREAGRPLVIAARRSPQGLGLGLPDLISRLAWDLVYHLEPLDEATRFAALRRRAHERGMEIPEEVVTFLSRRVPRDTHTLFEWLDRLDDQSLAAQKKITVPFVRELLESDSSSP